MALASTQANDAIALTDRHNQSMGYYYTRDHLGSVRELVDGSGNLLSRYTYDPYGRVTTTHTAANTSTPPIDATFEYTGDYYHAASGLNLTLAGDGQSTGRAYDPNAGRWLSRDPIAEAGGINLYEYVHDMPVDAIDPLGLDDQWFDAGTPTESHGWAEHTNYLTFKMTCPSGKHVDQVKLIYNSWEGGIGFWLGFAKNAGQGFTGPVKNVNCSGQASEVSAWENTRYAAPYAIGIYSNRANYVKGTKVYFTCKCCK